MNKTLLRISPLAVASIVMACTPTYRSDERDDEGLTTFHFDYRPPIVGKECQFPSQLISGGDVPVLAVDATTEDVQVPLDKAGRQRVEVVVDDSGKKVRLLLASDVPTLFTVRTMASTAIEAVAAVRFNGSSENQVAGIPLDTPRLTLTDEMNCLDPRSWPMKLELMRLAVQLYGTGLSGFKRPKNGKVSVKENDGV